jgi:hypothetical protein
MPALTVALARSIFGFADYGLKVNSMAFDSFGPMVTF